VKDICFSTRFPEDLNAFIEESISADQEIACYWIDVQLLVLKDYFQQLVPAL
jgi:hypothetical protein